MKLYAAFRDGRCVGATRNYPPQKDFKERHKGDEIRLVPLAEAMACSTPGFRKSLRFLQQSMEREFACKEVSEVEQ